MITSELYSIEGASENRRVTPTAPYLRDLNAPYLFATTDTSITDHSAIATEFGRYIFKYLSYGDKAPLTAEELSAYGLRLLTLASLSRTLSNEDYKFLLYSELDSLFLELIRESYYTRVENEIYKLPYSGINIENITRISEEIAAQMGLTEYEFTKSPLAFVPDSPFRSQARCIAISVSLELFFAELEKAGDGYEKYLSLIGEGSESDLTASLLKSGLTYPLSQDFLKKISDEIYYHINGYHYYDDSQNGSTQT